MNAQTTAAVNQQSLAFYNRISERVKNLCDELGSLIGELEEARTSFPFVHTSDSLGHWIPRGNEVATIISLLKEINVNESTMQQILKATNLWDYFGLYEPKTTTQELKPFVEKVCNEITSSIKLYVEDISEDNIVDNVYLDSEYRVQFSVSYDKILKAISDAKNDNFNYVFDREVFQIAAANKSTEIILSHKDILL